MCRAVTQIRKNAAEQIAKSCPCGSPPAGASGADEDVVVTLERGRITVKEDIGVNTPVFNARGILAEFKIVGTFEARPRAAPGS